MSAFNGLPYAGGPEEMSNAVIDLAANELAARLARKPRTKSIR